MLARTRIQIDRSRLRLILFRGDVFTVVEDEDYDDLGLKPFSRKFLVQRIPTT